MTLPARRALATWATLALVLVACGSGVSPGAGPEAKSSLQRVSATVDDAKVAGTSIDAFGLDLLRLNLGSTKANVALSPWSIATALAMTRAGAKGVTASEMDHVLHIIDPGTIHHAMNGLDQQLASRNGTFPGNNTDLTIELSAANRVFAQLDTHFLEPFLDTLAREYGASVGLVDYKTATEAARTTINSWVASRTHDRITELIKRNVLDVMTRLVLVNAVFLRADWARPFQKEQTRDAVFHTPTGDVTTPFMHDVSERAFASGDGWQAVELGYAGDELAMTVLVPDAGRFDDVVADLYSVVRDATTQTTTPQVILALPKFDIAQSLSLKEQLAALGMPTAFTDRADFTGITTDEPLLIFDVVHQANITVDEQGTVAAAATAVIVGTTSAPAEQRTLTVDRPFVFLLRDRGTGAILFAGQVTNPTTR